MQAMHRVDGPDNSLREEFQQQLMLKELVHHPVTAEDAQQQHQGTDGQAGSTRAEPATSSASMRGGGGDASQEPEPSAGAVNMREAARRFCEDLQPPQLQYVRHMAAACPTGRLAANAAPSCIQRKLCNGSNGPAAALQPTWCSDGLTVADLHWDEAGVLMPEAAHLFAFTLVKAVNVGRTGLTKTRGEPLRAVARACLFDRQHHRFLGCSHSIPADLRQCGHFWAFDPQAAAAVVRCGGVQAGVAGSTHALQPEHVSVLVELNVTYRLTIDDAAAVPRSEAKASRIVDELTTCWAMISMQHCADLAHEMEVTVPLYYGNMYEPVPLKRLYDQARQDRPFKALFTSAKHPTLTFRAGPLPQQPAPLVAYSLMPPTMIAPRHMAYALAAHRIALAQQLAAAPSAHAPLADASLAAFPKLLRDPALVHAFLQQWEAKCQLLAGPQGCLAVACLPSASHQEPPSHEQLLAAWRQCVLGVAPLLACSSLPPPHIGNFVEHAVHRRAVVNAFTNIIDPKSGRTVGPRFVVEPLSHAGAEFLHAPFSVAETRACLAR